MTLERYLARINKKIDQWMLKMIEEKMFLKILINGQYKYQIYIQSYILNSTYYFYSK